MRQRDWRMSASMQWDYAGRVPPEARLATPRVVHDIADIRVLHEFKQPRAIAAMNFREGLLALHQPGAVLALIHPFGRGDQGAVVWHEADVLKSPPTTRAYLPQKPPESRFWIFSSTSGAASVDGWSLPGWSINPVRRRIIVDCGQSQSGQSAPIRLAAAPVCLGDDRLGLLLRRADGAYLWAVADAAAREALTSFDKLPELSGLAGSPCQIDMTGRALAFATPLGHWIWSLADAAKSKADRLRRTWPLKGEQGRLVLNSEIGDPRERSWPRQIVSHSPHSDGVSDNLRWYYQEEGPPSIGKWYRVRLEEPFLVEQPRAIGFDGKGVLPLGLHQPRDADQGNSELLFLRDNRLLRQPAGGDTLSEVQGLLQGGSHLSGLCFHDPLLTCVVGVDSGGQSHADLSVEILSVEQPQVRATVPNLRLFADPLTWSSWLFTYEEVDGSFMVRRRWLGAEGV